MAYKLLYLSLFAFLLVATASATTPLCTNDWTGGACIGGITYTSPTTLLLSDVNASGNLTINAGVTLSTGGYSIWIGGNFINNGIIAVNSSGNAGAAGSIVAGIQGVSATNSLSGSGAGGGANSTAGGGAGGDTLVLGGAGGLSGLTPTQGANGAANSVIVVSNANIISWFNAGWQNKLSGAGGGAGAGDGTLNGGDGGQGSYGIYIQASNIVIAGVIEAAGNSGIGTGVNLTTGGGGGGGGGIVILAFNDIIGSLTGITAQGGSFGIATGIGGTNGGTGGTGNIISYHYIAQPLATPVVNTALIASSAPTPTSPTIDSGQSITLSIVAPTGGTSPYTYQWYSGTSSTCTSDTAISGATSLSYIASPSANTYYCVKETDTALSVVYTTTDLVTVNTALIASSAPTPTSPTIDSGQSIALSISAPTTGTSPYSYQWYSGTSSTCTSDTAVSGQTSLTYSSSPTSATYYCVQETDSAITPSIVYTPTDLVTVNPALVVSAAPTPTSPTIDSGQSITLTIVAPTGGTSPYTYQWYSGASATCTSDTAVSGQTSLTYSSSPTSSTYYCVQETDSASTKSVVYTGTDLVTVNTALVASAAPTPTSPTINSGQSIALSISAPTTGTSPYTYHWYSGTSATCTSDTAVSGQTSLTYSPSPPSNTYYCVQETDSASTKSVVYTGTDLVTVNPATTIIFSCAMPLQQLTFNNGQLYQFINIANTLTIFSTGGSSTDKTYLNSSAPNGQLYNVLSGASGTLADIRSGWYFKYDYSVSAIPTFTVQCTSSASGSNGNSAIVILQNQSTSTISDIAFFLFAIGSILFIIMLLNTLRIVRLGKGNLVGGMINFVLAFSSVILLLASGFYQETISTPSYTINSINQLNIVSTASITTIPLASNPIAFVLINFLSIASAIIGSMTLFTMLFFYTTERKNRRIKRAN